MLVLSEREAALYIELEPSLVGGGYDAERWFKSSMNHVMNIAHSWSRLGLLVWFSMREIVKEVSHNVMEV